MNTNTTTPKTHPRLARLISEGYTVKVRRFYVSEAGLPAADLILEKRGAKPEYLNNVYGKDPNVPGGRKHRFGKTEKDTSGGSTLRHEKNKEAKKEHNRRAALNKGSGAGAGSSGGASSVEKSGLGAGKTKK